MALTLGDLAQAIRLTDARFGRETVPNRILGAAFTRIQRRLAARATRRDSTFLVQEMSIVFDVNNANAPGTAGAGTSGGMPGVVDAAGAVGIADTSVGSGIEYDLDSAVEVVSEFVVEAPTASSVKKTGAGRGVNADANRLVHFVEGPGSGPDALRVIASNTADTWTITGTFGTTPTTATVARIIQTPPMSAENVGVYTQMPALADRVGYLVRLNATGQPYLDLTKPLLAQFEKGIPLPAHQKLLGGDVFLQGAINTASNNVRLAPYKRPFTLIPYSNRYRPAAWPCGYVLGSQNNPELFLIGQGADWVGATCIDLRYVPIPPAFGVTSTALTELFLLPDTAYEPLLAGGLLEAARYAKTRGEQIDLTDYQEEARLAEADWLVTVGQGKSAAIRTGRRVR